MPRRSPLFDVPAADADYVLDQTAVRLAAKRKVKLKTFDPTLGATPEEAEERLVAIRNDIGLYGEYVFGLKPARHHTLWNQVAEDVIYRRVRQNKLLLIAPPNSAKSTWNSLIRPTFHLGKHPDENILFFTSSDPMAKTFHSPVESALRENIRHRMVWPDSSARPDKARGWSTDGLYLRGTPPARKDPSYKAVGFGATIMGARARGIIIDDPLDQDEAQSETIQKRAKRYSDQTITPRITIGAGWMIAVMTRFHEADLASHYIRLAKDSGDWIYIRTPLLATNDPEPDPLGRQTGELLWPEVMTEVFVEAEQKRLTIGEFNLIHQGDPTGIGGDLFKEEAWFQPLPDDFWSTILPKCVIVQGWDMAFSESKRSCFTVCVSAAIDKQYNVYIIHVIRKRYEINAVEDLMINSIRMMKPMVTAIEYDKFHQSVVRRLAIRVMSKIMCNIQLVRPDSDKYARARLPAGRASAGKVFVNREADWSRTFIAECLGFPNTTYKDQVDSFSLVTHIVEQMDQAQLIASQQAKQTMIEHALR